MKGSRTAWLIVAFSWGIGPFSAVASTYSNASAPSSSPSYYWAVPERSLIEALTTPSSIGSSLQFLDDDSGTLEDLERQILHYPSHLQAVMLNSTDSTIACARGWLQPLQPLGVCGQPIGFFRNILFWDPARFNSPPHWAALWDVAGFPGQRAFFQGPRMTLEAALLAAGIPPQYVYATLSTPAGVNLAFQKLDQLRPYIVWWRSPSQAFRLLKNQAVLMGIAPAAIILSEQTRHRLARPYRAQTDDILYSPAVWGIPATLPTPKADETRAILLKSPPRLADPPETLPSESLKISDSFWAAHALMLTERFNAWLTQSASPKPEVK